MSDVSLRNRALIAIKEEAGKPSADRNSLMVVRNALYCIAPAMIWQLYSVQAGSGSKEVGGQRIAQPLQNYHDYHVDNCNETQKEVKTLFSRVLRTCGERQESAKFRLANPELFPGSDYSSD